MNLIILSSKEKINLLATNDPRAIHILKILKKKEGDTLHVGLLNGQISLSSIDKITEHSIHFTHNFNISAIDLGPIELFIGMPRPQTVKKILFEGTTLGVRHFHFFKSDHSEKSYLTSKIWREENYNQELMRGIEQSFSTYLPKVSTYKSLSHLLSIHNFNKNTIVLDNINASKPLKKASLDIDKINLMIGSERGWSKKERTILQDFQCCSLGKRILRVETAAISSIGIINSRLED